MPPSVSASSTSVSSSSSVIGLLSPVRKSKASSFFQQPNSQLIGARMTIKNLSSGAENIENFSGLSFARLFGEISPKISTTIVVAMVDTVAP